MISLIIIEIKEKVYCFLHLYYDNNDVIFICFPYPLNNNWLQWIVARKSTIYIQFEISVQSKSILVRRGVLSNH